MDQPQRHQPKQLEFASKERTDHYGFAVTDDRQDYKVAEIAGVLKWEFDLIGSSIQGYLEKTAGSPTACELYWIERSANGSAPLAAYIGASRWASYFTLRANLGKVPQELSEGTMKVLIRKDRSTEPEELEKIVWDMTEQLRRSRCENH